MDIVTVILPTYFCYVNFSTSLTTCSQVQSLPSDFFSFFACPHNSKVLIILMKSLIFLFDSLELFLQSKCTEKDNHTFERK